MSTGLTRFSCPIVEALPPAWVAEQKLPKPCVGQTGVLSGSPAASRRADAYCAVASAVWCAGPSRSGRPVEPYSSDPPVNTAAAWPVAASASA